MFIKVLMKQITSSKYGIAITSRKSLPITLSIKRWKAPGACLKLNGILTNSYSPQGVIKAVSDWLFF